MVAMCMNGLQGKGTSIDHALVFARRISIVVKSQHLGEILISSPRNKSTVGTVVQCKKSEQLLLILLTKHCQDIFSTWH